MPCESHECLRCARRPGTAKQVLHEARAREVHTRDAHAQRVPHRSTTHRRAAASSKSCSVHSWKGALGYVSVVGPGGVDEARAGAGRHRAATRQRRRWWWRKEATIAAKKAGSAAAKRAPPLPTWHSLLRPRLLCSSVVVVAAASSSISTSLRSHPRRVPFVHHSKECSDL